MMITLRALLKEGRLTERQVRVLEANGLKTLEEVAPLTPHDRRLITYVGPRTLAALDSLIAERLGGNDRSA
jgi:hypothetical protein